MAKRTLNKASMLAYEINTKIAESIIATMPTPAISEHIKTRLMQRVAAASHTFIFANQGEWKSIAVGIELKLLHEAGKAKSFLIKMAANTSIVAHAHSQNEESFVIDGEVWLEGILCYAGDFHYAAAGSQHESIRSDKGCTLLVKTL